MEGEDLKVVIRQETESDRRAVEECVRAAFWNVYRPGADEHFLAHHLRNSKEFISELSLVAVVNDAIVGSIMYTRSKILLAGGDSIETITFGPLAISPAFQRRGVGQKLIARSVRIAREMNFKAIVIYGDPRYYGKAGFRCAEKYDVQTSSGKFAVCLLALPLLPGALDGIHGGKFIESDAFGCCDNEAAVSEFDASFPHLDKITNTESQQEFKLLRSLSYHCP